MPKRGFVQTVLGPVSPSQLGITLTHEHVLSDLVGPSRSAKEFGERHETTSRMVRGHLGGTAAPESTEVPASLLGLWEKDPASVPYSDMARNWVYYRTMCQCFDIDAAIEEVMHFKLAGGGCIVDQSSIGMARDPVGLQRISRATGVHMVTVTGYYVSSTHPPDVSRMDEQALYEGMMQEIEEGAAGGVPVGLIGEVGLKWPVRPDEHKVLRAAARASAASGLPLSVHPGSDAEAPMNALRIVEQAGGDLTRTVLCHLAPPRVVSVEQAIQLASTGCYVSPETFGREATAVWQRSAVDTPNDATRLNWLLALVEAGHEKQILLSHDHAGKMLLHKWGGVGFDHMITSVVPLMRHKGLSNELIERILVKNPAEMLTNR